MTISANVNNIITWHDRLSDSAGREISDSSGVSFTLDLTDGVGTDQVNRLYYDRRTLSSGTTLDYDLTASLTNRRGESLTFARVKLIMVSNYETASGRIITVGGHPTAAMTGWVGAANDVIKVDAGGSFFLTCPTATGWVITNGTSDQLRVVTSGGGTVTYDLVIMGGAT